MSDIPTFFCEPTGTVHYERCFRCLDKTCDALTRAPASSADWPERPPKVPCEACSGATKLSSIGSRKEMRRTDTGEILTDSIWKYPGAVFESDGDHVWRSRDRFIRKPGPDGRNLTAICPDGHPWSIDGRARNCTMPNDDAHACWVRHGRPEDGTLHVDKNGSTCAAGAGSIDTGSWHGFLHHGKFTPC